MKLLQIVILLLVSLAAKANTDPVKVISAGYKDTYHLRYKGNNGKRVRVSIRDARNKTIFTEYIAGTSFVRPYNFEKLAYGQYSVVVESGSDIFTERIHHYQKQIVPAVQVAAVSGVQARFAVAIQSPVAEEATIRIYDNVRGLVFEDTIEVDKVFGQIYNLEKVMSRPDGIIMFEVTVGNTVETMIF